MRISPKSIQVREMEGFAKPPVANKLVKRQSRRCAWKFLGEKFPTCSDVVIQLVNTKPVDLTRGAQNYLLWLTKVVETGLFYGWWSGVGGHPFGQLTLAKALSKAERKIMVRAVEVGFEIGVKQMGNAPN